MKKHNICVGLIKVIATLYDNNSNAVMSNTITLEWSQTTVVVGQGCILSSSLFNVFLEEIMTVTLENFSGTVKIAGREVKNLRFANDIDLLAGSREELADLTSKLDSTAKKYGTEISAEKGKTMVTSRTTAKGSDVKIKVGKAKLEGVKTFSYLGSTINEEITSENEIKKRLVVSNNQLAKLNRIWNSSGISTTVKIRLIRSLITSIVLYGCETWIYNKTLEKRIASFELRCFWSMLGIT